MWGISGDYWDYGGQSVCARSQRDIAEIIKLCARILYYRFPDRQARKLSVGDACSPQGCSGHPPGSHGPRLNTIDFNYYTHGETNHTQYRPRDGVITQIWPVGKRGVELIESLYDWERNYLLWWMLRQALPESNFSTQNVIMDFMVLEITKKYGYAARKEFLQFTRADSGTTYNHHTHVHCAFGRTFNWDLDVGRLWLGPQG